MLKTVLRHLSEVLEVRDFVFTAGDKLVKNLNDALLKLFVRYVFCQNFWPNYFGSNRC